MEKKKAATVAVASLGNSTSPVASDALKSTVTNDVYVVGYMHLKPQYE